jgi:L-aspartate oxidase
MQFHPTALAVDRLPRPLLSEALRGDGALLRNAAGERFVDELQPRDIVARAITAQMLASGLDHAFLDVTPIREFSELFPSLAKLLANAGLDPARDWLPVAPAAHYLSGGIVVDLDGASALPHLWAAGEAACSGVHGANRLASNSLLDGLVFGARVVDAISKGRTDAEATGVMRCVLEPRGAWSSLSVELAPPTAASAIDRATFQHEMTLGAGVLRDAESLDAAAGAAASARASEDPELANLGTVATALVESARIREESRGAHARTDFPNRDDEDWRTRIVVS